jgi:hypothetical protein
MEKLMNQQQDDKAQALIRAAAAWAEEVARKNPKDFEDGAVQWASDAAGSAVNVVLLDMGGDRPRIQLYIGKALMGQTHLERLTVN